MGVHTKSAIAISSKVNDDLTKPADKTKSNFFKKLFTNIAGIANTADNRGWFVNRAKNRFFENKITAEKLKIRINGFAAHTKDVVQAALFISRLAEDIRLRANAIENSEDLKNSYLKIAFELRFKASDAYKTAASLDKSNAWHYTKLSFEERSYALMEFPKHPAAMRSAQLMVTDAVTAAKRYLTPPKNGHSMKPVDKFNALMSASAYYEFVNETLLQVPDICNKENFAHLENYYTVLSNMLDESYVSFMSEKQHHETIAKKIQIGKNIDYLRQFVPKSSVEAETLELA